MLGKPFELVVGKGGVGKSTVTAALATGYAAAGYRTLAVELATPAGLARAFNVSPGSSREPEEVTPGLSYTWIDGENALAEYLALVVPVRRVLSTVLDSRLYKYFVAAAPGLKELMTIGKLWYEHDREEGGRKVWDRIVVDAGASGHSLQYLRMPDAAAKTFNTGLVHRESEKILDFLRDETRTCVHVVATPESMPMAEAAEIVEQLRGDLDLPLGRVLVNKCRGAVPEGAGAALARLGNSSEPALDSLVASGRRNLAWYALQEEAITLFEGRTSISVERLPLLVADEFGRAELLELARLLADPSEAAP